MSDEAGFLKAMAANPTDSLIPLVYADWFDERNDPRGTLLRVWVDLSWRASHAGHGFRDLLDEYRRRLGVADPVWRREFGAHRRWVDARLAEELTRGYLRYVERFPPGHAGVTVGSAKWFEEGAERRGWLVSFRTAYAQPDFNLPVFVQPEFGWVYPVGERGAGAWLARYDANSGQGYRF